MAYQSGQQIQVTIPGPGPWGFRLAGGKDFNTPLHISKITPGGKAARANLLPNDTVASINGVDTSSLTHLDSQNKIKSTVGDLHLNIQRGGSNIWKPKITDDFSTPSGGVNVSLAADKQKFTHAGSSHNVAAKPFPGGGGGGGAAAAPGLGTATVVHKQFNSPVGIYSSENIAETFKGQTEGMISGALGTGGGGGAAPYGGGGGGGGGGYETGSPVYQAVHAGDSGGDWNNPNPGAQSRSFKMLQQMTDTDATDAADYGNAPAPAPVHQAPTPAAPPPSGMQQPVSRTTGTRSVSAPKSKPGAGGPKPDATLPMCEGCNRAIVGQLVHVNPPDEERPRWDGPFVKVRNRSLHPECFKCQTCGCSLRNQGYFWVEGGMYCERDARAKASSGGPSGGPSGPGPASHGPPNHGPASHGPASHGPASHGPTSHGPPSHGGVTNGTARPAPVHHQPQQRAPVAHAPAPARVPAQPRPGAPRSQPVPVKPPPNPPPKPVPRFQTKPKSDPNAIIAMALAKNPDATKDIRGVQPVFTVDAPVKHEVIPAAQQYLRDQMAYDMHHQEDNDPWSGAPPALPSQPKPRFVTKQTVDPNAIIAMALAKNPASTKDCLGIQPVFTKDDTTHHEVIPEHLRSPPPPMAPKPKKQHHQYQDPGAPKDGVKVMFLPNDGAGVKQSPSQVAQQSRAPKVSQSPPRSGVPHQAGRPGGPSSGYHPPAAAPAVSRGPQAPRGSAAPSKMADTGTRTPICDGCNTIIKGPFVSAIGRNWHPEHFVCTHCHENLKDRTFVEEKGKIYCEDDFVKLYAEKCHKCGKNIGGPGVSALGGKYHPECFVCECCKEPISGGKFRMSDGKPFCEKDYRALHSTMCSGCEFIIDPGDPWLEALDKAWHANCFVCSICQTALEGQSFYAKMGRPFCQAHAN